MITLSIIGSISLLTGCGKASKPEIPPVQTAPKALNEQGVVVGGLRPAVDALPAFVAIDGIRHELPSPPDTSWAMPQGINAQGQIIGYATEPSLQTRHAFLWEPISGSRNSGSRNSGSRNSGRENSGNRQWRAKRLDDSGFVSSEATAINAQGDIVGTTWTSDGAAHTCLWQQGVRREIRDATASSSNNIIWHPTAINARCEIVGWGTDAQNRVHTGYCSPITRLTGSATIAPANWIDLGIGYEVAINNEGDIVGDFRAEDGRFHACRWQTLSHDSHSRNGQDGDIGTNRRRIALESLPDTEESHALAINRRGQIVGRAIRTATNTTEPGAPVPVLWEQGHIIDLSRRLVTRFDGKLEEAIAINDSGQILCTARQGIWGRAVLLTPGKGGYAIQVF